MHCYDIEKLWAVRKMKWGTLDVLVTPDNHFTSAHILNQHGHEIWESISNPRLRWLQWFLIQEYTDILHIIMLYIYTHTLSLEIWKYMLLNYQK